VPQVPIEECKKFSAFQDLNADRQICAGGEEGQSLNLSKRDFNLPLKFYSKCYLSFFLTYARIYFYREGFLQR
jgi:hypothetical protein